MTNHCDTKRKQLRESFKEALEKRFKCEAWVYPVYDSPYELKVFLDFKDISFACHYTLSYGLLEFYFNESLCMVEAHIHKCIRELLYMEVI